MALKGRVGRHTRTGGRHCQNWSADQQTVIDLLNRIPVSAGGSGGTLAAGRIVNGVAGDALYAAITRFEDRQAPGQRSGFIDPGGALFKRMESLAGGSAKVPQAPAGHKPPAEIPLDALRRDVLDDARWSGMTAGELVDFDPLVKRAAKHVDDLKEQRFVKLAWPVELLGRAFITKGKKPSRDLGSGSIQWEDVATGEQENSLKMRHLWVDRKAARPLPEMSYFKPVDQSMDITTGHLGALLLFNESFGNVCARILPYRHGKIAEIGRYLQTPNNDAILLPAKAYSLGDFARHYEDMTYISKRQTDQTMRDIERIKRETEEIKRRK